VDRPAKQAAASLRMGEMDVGRDGDQLRTLLGSCIGLALYDRTQKIGGLAHILLPVAPEVTDRPGKFVDTAIPELIKEMNQLATTQLRLTAKIAGGASMFSSSIAANIGIKNTEACQQLLSKMGIPIVAENCGGNQGRRMTLDTTDGKVLIEIVGEEAIRL
jgi:chemotaxis protein CheD